MKPSIETAEIVCVGTELLIGQTLNTNSHFLARELSLMGISSYYQSVVGDNPRRLKETIQTAAARSDCVFLTGGLGPTADDITMAIAADAAQIPLVRHEQSVQAIQEIFSRLGRTMTENNLKQAMLPEGAHILPNRNGTAPGCILEMNTNGKTTALVLLPGPPSELRPMFLEQVRPYLRARTSRILRNVFVRMIGIGESAAETRLKDLIDGQTNPTIAPYAGEGEVLFRITQLVSSEEEPDHTGPLLDAIRDRLGEFIYEVGDRKMHEVVAGLLTEKGKTLSLAESCTAGMVSSTLGEISGASCFLLGGVIAYSNRIKQSLLKVSSDILEEDGAVSERCAKAMAVGCREQFGSDLAVSVTGVAGPDGGTADKPVGMVWMAVADGEGCQAALFRFTGNRARIRHVATLQALNLIRRRLLE